MEDSTDAGEELTGGCKETQNDLKECQNKLSLVGTETQLPLSIMQVKYLPRELSQWQKLTPETITHSGNIRKRTVPKTET